MPGEFLTIIRAARKVEAFCNSTTYSTPRASRRLSVQNWRRQGHGSKGRGPVIGGQLNMNRAYNAICPASSCRRMSALRSTRDSSMAAWPELISLIRWGDFRRHWRGGFKELQVQMPAPTRGKSELQVNRLFPALNPFARVGCHLVVTHAKEIDPPSLSLGNKL